MYLSDKVYALIRALNMTQRELSNASGVSQSSICAYVAGIRGTRPSYDILKKLQKVAKKYKIDVDFLEDN